MSAFSSHLYDYFDTLSERLLAGLNPGEDLNLNLQAEDSLFVRLNNTLVRQNTNVEQILISLRLQANHRSVEKTRTLRGNAREDYKSLLQLLEECRQEAAQLPEDPYQVAMQNNGTSREEFLSTLLQPEELVDALLSEAKGLDLAGLYTAGAVIRANRNSLGQNHWFATENFSLDYSLYNGPQAAKGMYSGAKWDNTAWKKNVQRTRGQLELLQKPKQNIAAGKYRCYLAPQAFAELINMLGWGALSAASWKQGRSAFKKLADGEAKLSPLFSLKENFGLGLTPRFNALGEVSPSSIDLIQAGKLNSLLVSSRSAKEYGLTPNFAAPEEYPRSLDVATGSLDESKVLQEIGTGFYLSNLHYLNWSDPVSARVTGMTRYACFWVSGGEIAGPIQDMRFDESLYDALGNKLMALGSHGEIDPDTSSYMARGLGGKRVPGALIDQFTFTL
jgi:predicted Zn-dependent protease